MNIDSPLPVVYVDGFDFFLFVAYYASHLRSTGSHRLEGHVHGFFLFFVSPFCAFVFLVSPLHRPTPSPSLPLLSVTLGRLLGSELVRIRPNRAVSSVGRERTSATRDAASSP